ncbi:MAG: toll/interleukin-1 receptor domain-containing protein [Bryobacteraceae bacterium]
MKDELDAHLSALKHSGMIEIWNDRKIGPGDEWKNQIDKRLTEANIILLLISADFLASDFCYRVETRNALDRHGRGEAIVVPVVLRDVDFRGLSIASLQMLPQDAVPVTSNKWTSRDEAWKNVAEGIRESIERLREQVSQVLESWARSRLAFEARYLDAAIAREIPVGVTREIVALVRLKDSKGLIDTLPERPSSASAYSCCASDVGSEPFEAKFVIAGSEAPKSPVYRLSVDAQRLLVKDSDKQFELDPGHDSARFTFLVEAEEPGEKSLRVNLFRGDHYAAGALLRTRSGGDLLPSGGGLFETLVASVKLRLNVISKSVSVGAG